jgi:hypothetical protein
MQVTGPVIRTENDNMMSNICLLLPVALGRNGRRAICVI